MKIKNVKAYQVGREIFVVNPRNSQLHEIKTGRGPTEAEWTAIQAYLGPARGERQDSRAQEE